MTTLRRQAQNSGSQAPVRDWDGFANALHWPAGLSWKDRIALFRRGKRDARHGLVIINEYGEISSPFCETLVQAANQRIALEWMNCGKNSVTALAEIERANIRIAQLEDQLRRLTIQRDEALEAIDRRHYDGDDAVSDHLAQRRRQHREQPVREQFEALGQSIRDRLAETEFATIPHRYALSQAEEIAESHEQLVRADYLWRLSIYAYGASNYIKVTPDMINDTALSEEPKEKHKRLLREKRSQEAEDRQ